MKILIVSYQNSKIMPGGAQQVAHDELIAALKAGHDVWQICVLEEFQVEHANNQFNMLVRHGNRKRVFNSVPSTYDLNMFEVQSKEFLDSICKFIINLNPDVVHFHHYHRVGLNLIFKVKTLIPKSIICLSFHEMLAICRANGQMRRLNDGYQCDIRNYDCNKCFPNTDVNFFDRRKEKILSELSIVDCFIFPSNFVMNLYAEWGIDKQKCIVVPNGQPEFIINNYSNKHTFEVNRFGFFGQLIQNKGLHCILDAIDRLTEHNIVIEIDINASIPEYPGYSYPNQILERIATLNKSNKNVTIKLNGPYSRSELTERMQLVDWVIVPSLWPETFALVMTEAWAHGRPVITSNIGAMATRIRNGVDGIAYNPYSIDELARAMLRAAYNQELWLKLNSGIIKQFSDTQMVERLCSIWKSLSVKDRAI